MLRGPTRPHTYSVGFEGPSVDSRPLGKDRSPHGYAIGPSNARRSSDGPRWFASVVAALGRPLSAVRRQRFLALLFLALVQVLTCLLPIWLSNLLESEESIWRIASLAAFGVAMISIGSTVVYPLLKIDPRAHIVLNPIANVLVQFLTVASVILLPLNAIDVIWEPGF